MDEPRTARRFLEALAPAQRSQFAAAPTLAQELAALWRAGKAAWPTITLTSEAFAEHLARVWAEGRALGDLSSAPGEDLYLACACAKGNDDAAAAAFDDAYGSHMRAIAGRLDVAYDLRAEAVQRARAALLVAADGRPPKLAAYRGRGSLLAFVRIVTVRAGLELLRRREPSRGAEELDDAELLELDPELAYLRELYRGKFKAAFADAIAELDPRERTLLRYQLADGLSIDALAKIYGVHRATAARQLTRAREALARRTAALLRERLGLDSRELESVLRLVRSQLDLSAQRLLSETGE